MTTIYGIDTEKEVTPIMVRDAILECFFKAHCYDTGIAEDNSGSTREYCNELVQKAFVDAGANFTNPSKDDLQKVIEGLAVFSKNFRDQEVVAKHFAEIQGLIDLIK